MNFFPEATERTSADPGRDKSVTAARMHLPAGENTTVLNQKFCAPHTEFNHCYLIFDYLTLDLANVEKWFSKCYTGVRVVLNKMYKNFSASVFVMFDTVL